MLKRLAFGRDQRLRKSPEFDRVYGNKVYATDDILVINAARNEFSVTRLGLSIGRKCGNAVTRNRWKRKIREAFRQQQHSLPVGLDLVVRPRKGAEPDFAKIYRAIEGLVKRLDRKLD